MRHVEGAIVARLAVDPVAFDCFKHLRRGITQHLVQTLAVLLAQGRFNVIRLDPGTGIDQTDVTTRTAMANLECLQQADLLSILEKVQRS
ncbi:hypothetical protein D9M72_382870 [compost metagenome]